MASNRLSAAQQVTILDRWQSDLSDSSGGRWSEEIQQLNRDLQASKAECARLEFELAYTKREEFLKDADRYRYLCSLSGAGRALLFWTKVAAVFQRSGKSGTDAVLDTAIRLRKEGL